MTRGDRNATRKVTPEDLVRDARGPPINAKERTMSQRIFVVNHPEHGRLEVMGGWDRPLSYSYLVVLNADGPIYSNLDDHEGPDVSPTQARAVLERLEIAAPTGFLDAFERDRAEKPGNLEAQYLPYTGNGRPQLEIWYAREQGPDGSPYLEETHLPVYTCLEAEGTVSEIAANMHFQHFADPTNSLIARLRLRPMRVRDVVRVQHAAGMETLERTMTGWKVRSA
jgi:hypothetical protein